MIAMKTMHMPLTKAIPTLRTLKASMIGMPSPGPAMNAAMMAIERAAMMVWFSPTMIVRLAIGSCTLVISCDDVEPSAVVASIVVGETVLSPWAEIRISGGRA